MKTGSRITQIKTSKVLSTTILMILVAAAAGQVCNDKCGFCDPKKGCQLCYKTTFGPGGACLDRYQQPNCQYMVRGSQRTCGLCDPGYSYHLQKRVCTNNPPPLANCVLSFYSQRQGSSCAICKNGYMPTRVVS